MHTSLMFVSHVILNMYACGFVSLTSITQFKHCKSQNVFVLIRGTKSCIKGLGVLHKGSPFVSFVSLQLDFLLHNEWLCMLLHKFISFNLISFNLLAASYDFLCSMFWLLSFV